MDPVRAMEDLRRPEAYAGLLETSPSAVEVVQTHISVLFLTPEEVFKVKKPLDLHFLDFSTVQAREHFCREEVRLNRPLAGDVYRGVVPVTEGGDGRLHFGGAGNPVDWAVRMRRLPENRMLDELLRGGDPGAVTPAMLEAVAVKIAEFHAAAPSRPAAGAPEAVRRMVVGNVEEVEPHVGRSVTGALFAYLLRQTQSESSALAPVFEARARDGCVREGHGDLHSEHICFTDPLVIYDRLEFSEAFRTTDVAAEVAFLAMDLDHRGRRDLSAAWLEAYRRHAPFELPVRLLDYYLFHRAAVRGKVLAIKSENAEIPAAERERAEEKARDYFALAFGYAQRARDPILVATMGPIASGKSWLAGWLAERTGWPVFASDPIRKRLAGMKPTDRPAPGEVPKLYGAAMSEKTYEAMLDGARAALEEGHSAILDATHSRRADRDAVRALAARMGTRCVLLHLDAPRELLERRLLEREGREEEVSDARVDLLPRHLAAWELPEPGEPSVVSLDAAAMPGVLRSRAVDALIPGG